MFLSSLMAIAAVLIMGEISPGPSFVFGARNAVASSRRHGRG
ncbi:LysE family translocator, partial [Klebsiella pneumoniae]|nr:LysE family translocator [Klebsiella pneumoniae]